MAGSVIRLQGEASVSETEEYLEALARAAPDTDLLLPRKLPLRQLGGTSAVLQLVLTWYRRCPQGALRLHLPGTAGPTDAPAIDNFLTTDHGFLAFVLRGRLLSADGSRDVTEAARRLADARLAQMDDVTAAVRGPKLLLACADHTAWAAPAPFYKRGAETVEIGGLEHYRTLARRLSVIAGTGRRHRAFDRAQVRHVGTLVRELVRNTHEWARSDEAGTVYDASVRGLRAELHLMSDQDLERAVAGQEPLADWATQPEVRASDGRYRLVELTVFDTGPGLAARRLHELGEAQPEIADEYAALRDCLRRHFSTAADPERGVGLDQVLHTLTSLRAFLRVRTGRINLYRDFAATPYAPASSKDEPWMLDWRNRIATTTEPPVAGTTYTVLFPLVFE